MEQAYKLHGDVLAEHGVNRNKALEAEENKRISSEKPEATSSEKPEAETIV